MTDHPDAPETAWVFLHPNLRQILQDASSEYMHAGEAVKAHNMRCALQALDRMAKVICIFNKMSKGGTAIEPNSLNGLFKAWLDDALKDIEERQETVEPKKKSNKEQFLDMLDSSIPSDANSFGYSISYDTAIAPFFFHSNLHEPVAMTVSREHHITKKRRVNIKKGAQ